MKRGILKAQHLSTTGAVLGPQYGLSGPVLSLADDDRLFDPVADRETHKPLYEGTLQNKQDFSQWRYSGVDVYLLIIKEPQSDRYFIPDELLQNQEFLQRSINREHNRSALAFTCAAYLAVRQGTSTANMWHFDQGDRIRTDYPTRTYLAVDQLPTEFLFRHKFSSHPKLLKEFNDSADPHAFELMTRLSGQRDLQRRPVGGRDIRTYEPYDITSHDRMVLHRGVFGRQRTGIVLYYASSDSFYRRNVMDNPMMPGLKHVRSSPYQDAPALLKQHYKELRCW